MRVGDRSVERESVLTLLIVFLGGVTLQLFAAWPWSNANASASRRVERRRWLALWWPAAPASVVVAWLCGWALSQPDEYAAKLQTANVTVDHICWPGMIHGFASMAGVLDAGKAAIDRIGAALRKALG
jgi:hypothetical protein